MEIEEKITQHMFFNFKIKSRDIIWRLGSGGAFESTKGAGDAYHPSLDYSLSPTKGVGHAQHLGSGSNPSPTLFLDLGFLPDP